MEGEKRGILYKVGSFFKSTACGIGYVVGGLVVGVGLFVASIVALPIAPLYLLGRLAWILITKKPIEELYAPWERWGEKMAAKFDPEYAPVKVG